MQPRYIPNALVTAMRIGIVSYRFPPYNAIGAVSVGKTAKYLERLGHEIRILTARSQPLEPTLDLEVDATHVHATKWVNLAALPEAALGGRAAVARTGFSTTGTKGRMLKPLGRAYRAMLHIPDPQIGWYPYALSAGRDLFRRWRPDVLFASAGPYTSLIVASRLARDLRLPWVAGFRDLWTDNPYRDLPRWRRRLEVRLERQVVGTASGLVTVSEPLAAVLRSRFDLPVAVVMNGFDDEDVALLEDEVVRSSDPTGPLVISYTGTIVEGRRDPTPLFRAMRGLGVRRDDIVVRFVGRYAHAVDVLRRREGVADLVEIGAPVSHRDAVAMQRASDVLLLLLWDDPRETGVMTGKVFEYLGARRPILCIGCVDGEPGRLIRDRQAGVTTNSPEDIARQLSSWLAEKRAGGLPDVPGDRLDGLTRRAQTERLSDFLGSVVESGDRRLPST